MARSGPASGGNTALSYNNGSFVSSNATTVQFSTSYNGTTHTFGSISDPGSTYVGNGGSPVIDTGTTASSYEGLVTNTRALTPFTNVGDGVVGYYRMDIQFTSSAARYGFSGEIRADNAVYDVFLDYSAGSTPLTLALNTTNAPGSNAMRTTDNVPSSVTFNGTRTLTAGTHTLSFIFYNNSGPATASFEFTSYAIPEPGTALLLVPGLALLPLLRRRFSL